MKTTNSNVETKRQNMIRIFQYILKQEKASRQEISVALGYSLPTVFQNVHELIEWGGICEAGVYGSTGGRKAKVLQIKEGFRYVIGANITRQYISLVLCDLCYKIIDQGKEYLPYENTQSYYRKVSDVIQKFIKKNHRLLNNPHRLIGIGFSLPGIIDHSLGMLRQSSELNISHIDIRYFSQYLPYDFCFENNANCAMYMTLHTNQTNAVYLALNDSVEGSVFINGKNYSGDNFKTAQLGHTVLMPNGRPCSCGKKGCLNAYLSASSLTQDLSVTPAQFFQLLEENDSSALQVWDEYLEYLAIAVSNIRMIFDCDVILGGTVSEYLEPYMRILREKIFKYNKLDFDTAYLSVCPAQESICASGAAKYMIDQYIFNMDILREG